MPILHPQEEERLRVLRALELLDTSPEPEFDTVAAVAKRLFDCPMGFLSLVDAERQWIKAQCESDLCEASREVSFCSHAVAADAALVVRDALLDPRFVHNPMVLGPPFVRFYAGVPVRARACADGPLLPVGAVCVVDDRPREETADQLEQLAGLARVVEALFEARRMSREGLRLALERHDALVEADRNRRQLAQAERIAGVGSWRLDLATSHVDWSDQTYALHGLSPGGGETLDHALEFYPPADRARLMTAVAACAEHGTPYDLELDCTDAQGISRRLRAMGEPDVLHEMRVALIGVVQDISERHRHELELRRLLNTDELTRICNRRAFNRRLDEALDQAMASGEPLAVALLDLDRFKQVNDLLGHPAGDETLRTTATALRQATYLDDYMPARLGGDEFALVLRGPAAAERLADGIQRLLADLVQIVPTPSGPITVSATIGVARLHDGVEGRSALLKLADQALYRAKKHRRGSAAIAGSPRHLSARPGPVAAAA